MGSGASLPDQVDETTAKEVCGIHYDKNKFNQLQVNGLVSRIQFLELLTAHHAHLQKKFCEVADVFTKDLWEPLLKSTYYDVMFNPDFGMYA
jgi:hypothetical protein